MLERIGGRGRVNPPLGTPFHADSNEPMFCFNHVDIRPCTDSFSRENPFNEASTCRWNSRCPKQATLSPAQSPSKSSTDSTTQSTTTKTMDTSSSLTTVSGNLLKAAIAKSLTEKSPEEKVIEPLSLFFTNFVALSGGGLQERTSNSG